MKKQILRNIFSNYLAAGLGMVVGFLLVPFLIRKLGKDAYGLIALAEATIIFFEIVTVSVRTALSRHATFTLSQGKVDEFAAYLSTGRVILFGSAALVFLSGSVVSWFFGDIFRMPAALVEDSRRLFFLITVAFSIAIPNTVFWSVLYARQRFDLINFSTSFGTLTRAGLLFVLFNTLSARHVNLVTYGVVYLAMTWAQNVMIYAFHRGVMPPGVKVRMDRFRPDAVREILSFSVHTSINRLSTLFVGNTVTVLINLFWGPAWNAVYSVAQRLPTLMRRIFAESTWALTPTFTDLVARGDRDRMERLFFLYSKLLAVVTVPLSLVLVLLGPELIRWWVGPDFDESGRLMIFYALPLLLGIPFAVCGCINNAYGRVKVPSLVGLFASVLNLGCGVLLAKPLGMGLYGFATANLVSGFAYVTLFGPYYSCRLASISVRRYFSEAFVKPLVVALPILGGGVWVMRQARPALAIDAASAAQVAGLIAVYYASSYFLLRPEERRHVDDLLRGLRRRLVPEGR